MRTSPKPNNKKLKMKLNISYNGLSLLMATAALFSAVVPAQAADKKPNILFIMGDDIGIMQPECYHQGLMVGETPNIDRIAAEGGASWTTTPCRAAPPGAAPLSPAWFRCARA